MPSTLAQPWLSKYGVAVATTTLPLYRYHPYLFVVKFQGPFPDPVVLPLFIGSPTQYDVNIYSPVACVAGLVTFFLAFLLRPLMK